MMPRLAVLLLLASFAWTQDPTAADAEEAALREAMNDAGPSRTDFIRTLERHLARYPQTTRRPDLERAIVKAALELRDARRILLYGPSVIERDPGNVELLERLARYLLDGDDKDRATRARDYAVRLEKLIAGTPPPAAGERNAAAAAERRAILLGKALLFQARATGNLGDAPAAEQLARRALAAFPSAEALREVARWLERQGKLDDAVFHLAEAFMIPDPNLDRVGRARDRQRLSEWYRRAHPNESGLGEITLAAYDRAARRVDAHRDALRALDPNAELSDLMQFTLSGLDGEKLLLSSLKGKVLVLDFWATWCGPCRVQHPLYEQVKQRFKDSPDVVFLNINTDENRALVKPFLTENGWSQRVFFEDGLSMLLGITSIPTTVIVNRQGQVSSTMVGFLADRFVDMLTERIRQSLTEE